MARNFLKKKRINNITASIDQQFYSHTYTNSYRT